MGNSIRKGNFGRNNRIYSVTKYFIEFLLRSAPISYCITVRASYDGLFPFSEFELPLGDSNASGVVRGCICLSAVQLSAAEVLGGGPRSGLLQLHSLFPPLPVPSTMDTLLLF